MFKENVGYPILTCRDPIHLILGTRFSLIVGTRIWSIKHLKKTLVTFKPLTALRLRERVIAVDTFISLSWLKIIMLIIGMYCRHYLFSPELKRLRLCWLRQRLRLCCTRLRLVAKALRLRLCCTTKLLHNKRLRLSSAAQQKAKALLHNKTFQRLRLCCTTKLLLKKGSLKEKVWERQEKHWKTSMIW